MRRGKKKEKKKKKRIKSFRNKWSSLLSKHISEILYLL